MRPDPLRDKHPVSPKRYTRQSASFLRSFRLLKKGIFPTARLHRTTNQSIPNNTSTIVAFDAVTWDRVSDEAEGHADWLMAETANDRLKIRIPGIYVINATVIWDINSTGRRALVIRLNGSNRWAASQPADPSSTTDQTITTIYELAKDDLIELACLQSSGGALNLTSVSPYSPSLSAVWGAL